MSYTDYSNDCSYPYNTYPQQQYPSINPYPQSTQYASTGSFSQSSQYASPTSYSQPQPLPPSSYGMTTVSPQDISYRLSSTTMRRKTSGSSASSYSSHHYGSSTGTSPPAEFPDQQDSYSNDQQFPNWEVVDGGVYHSSNKATKSANRKSGSKGGEGKLLHCISPKCEYKTERQFDLDRHMNKHFPPSVEKLLPCPGRGCGRTGEHGFRRKDHLTEHLRKVHAQHEKYPKTLRGGKRSSTKEDLSDNYG